ncbi:MAG: DNA-deoxyinosine glycosylase [Ruminococcus sp.]|nr:DNA-deoxyinosine glycosylase [Ruminococcus sp.]
MELKHIVHDFEPVYDKKSRILILGSLPSVKSREQGFYYGHPQNRFWRVMAALFNEELPTDIPSKKKLLLCHGVALWDVISECDISGSSDASIKNAVPAKLQTVLSKADIKRIYVNGTTAKRIYDRHQRNKLGREALLLPSTSPANASIKLNELIDAWRVITEDTF